MKKLHIRDNTNYLDIEPSEGERTLLCSNNCGMRSPSLDLGITANSTEDELLEILADILLEGFLLLHEHQSANTKECRSLLPSVNEGTG